MEQILNNEVKNIIVEIAKNPEYAKQVEKNLLSELVDMDIFYFSDGLFKSNTAIFLEDDIKKLTSIVFSLSDEMSSILNDVVKDFIIPSPATKNFICAIIAMGQGLHSALINIGMASEWQIKTGKYEKSRVDFNEDCSSYHAFGKDLQNKNILKGNSYTAATIGYDVSNPALTKDLVDIFPLVILGKIEKPELKLEAQSANIDINDKYSVITLEQSREYQLYIDKISCACNNFYCENLTRIENFLLSTTSGKSGAPPKNMMMNFWRYMRKAIAMRLYENGFLSDKIPENGRFTIFYENSIGYFNL